MKLFLFTVSMIVVVTVNCRRGHEHGKPHVSKPLRPKPPHHSPHSKPLRPKPPHHSPHELQHVNETTLVSTGTTLVPVFTTIPQNERKDSAQSLETNGSGIPAVIFNSSLYSIDKVVHGAEMYSRDSRSGCYDRDHFCRYWSNKGDCDKNPGYMLKLCPKSCAQCGNFRADHRCGNSFLAHNGEPAQCNPENANHCCSRHGWCGGSYGHCKCSDCVDYRESSCYDRNQFCRYWSNRDECHNNPGYMLKYCPKSCTQCGNIRADHRCGNSFLAHNGEPAQCNPENTNHCCSRHGWCGGSNRHCKCSGCVDYRDTSCQCGIINTSRIVGGTEVNSNRKYPWQVGLVSSGYYIKCGGTIINNRWILTAAHCITDLNTCTIKYDTSSTLRVTVGEHHQFQTNDDDSNTKKYSIKTYINHPNFNCQTLDYDFALLELTEAIPFNNIIRPVCLPKDDSKTYAGQTGTVTGWGRTSTGGALSHFLREVQVPILANDNCGNYRPTPAAMKLCAGGEEGKDSCGGDSGGPIHVVENNRYVQVGVVSYGSTAGCASTQYPGVYARVSKVIPWITTTTASGKKCD